MTPLDIYATINKRTLSKRLYTILMNLHQSHLNILSTTHKQIPANHEHYLKWVSEWEEFTYFETITPETFKRCLGVGNKVFDEFMKLQRKLQ